MANFIFAGMRLLDEVSSWYGRKCERFCSPSQVACAGRGNTPIDQKYTITLISGTFSPQNPYIDLHVASKGFSTKFSTEVFLNDWILNIRTPGYFT